ncbi:MAG: EAL domain-containing protein [Nitrosomonadales bacterium]|nr:EAL domain-containing protein [Nitrosomonadales bacterium]
MTDAEHTPAIPTRAWTENQANCVLIVDDEPIARASMEALLAPDGYRLLKAESGLRALEILEDEVVDLVLLDVMMPELDGYEVCRRIRATTRLSELPVVMVTALDDRDSRLQGLLTGADDFVSKPFDGAELRARVKTIVRLNRYRRLLEQTERLAYLEDFDPLTDLPNRRLLESRLAQALFRARRVQEGVALLLLDLDDFDRMIEALGQQASDEMLKEVAARLLSCVRGQDTVARLSSDRFAVLFESIKPMQDVALAAQRVRAALEKPVVLNAHEVVVTGSIGISLYPADGERAHMLVQNAFTAMAQAKRTGKNRYQFFSQEMNVAALERIDLEADLRRALENQEMELYYQPKVSGTTRHLLGLEALIRWQHPQRGLIGPGEFIALAEENGLIEPLGEWVMQRACRQIKAWRNAGLPVVPVAVNISSRQFRYRFLEIPKVVAEILARTGVEPHLLELELTESLLMPDEKSGVSGTLAALNELKALGVRLSIDDFGTGYSSLNYLHRFPVDALKVDRSFIIDILSSSDDATITTSIIQLAHNLGLKVVAEGVETEAQLEFLNQRDCDQIQGYYFSQPIPASGIEVILRGKSEKIMPPIP